MKGDVLAVDKRVFPWKNSALEMLLIMKYITPDRSSIAMREMALIIKRE